MKPTFSRLAAATGLALCLVPAASALVIDDFESGDFQLSLRGDAATTPRVIETVSGATILGGQRKATLQIREGGGTVSAATFGAAVGVGTAPGGVLLLSDSFAALAALELSYDNLGGTDLTADGSNAIAVNFRGVDGVSRVFVRVDTATGSDTLTQRAYAFNSPSATQSFRDSKALVYAYDDFASTLDFSRVNRIVVGFGNVDSREVNGFPTGATDIAVESITTIVVPEPTTALLATAGLGLLATRRRRG